MLPPLSLGPGVAPVVGQPPLPKGYMARGSIDEGPAPIGCGEGLGDTAGAASPALIAGAERGFGAFMPFGIVGNGELAGIGDMAVPEPGGEIIGLSGFGM